MIQVRFVFGLAVETGLARLAWGGDGFASYQGIAWAMPVMFRIRASLYRLRKKSVLHLTLGGAAVYRCDGWLFLASALQVAEKLYVAFDFGWRSASALR